ncbi:MAG: hypothetical protein H6728_01270 [Myxococcales bacterium]|nr:hypothetical protein [Myxococcales bacterium]MCB9641683.1 hypothetical protein [Myxococcales bacterium]
MRKVYSGFLVLALGLLWMPAPALAHGGYEGLFMILVAVGVLSLLGVVLEILQLVWMVKCFRGTASARVVKWCKGLGIYHLVMGVIFTGIAGYGYKNVDVLRIMGLWALSFFIMGGMGVFIANKVSASPTTPA